MNIQAPFDGRPGLVIGRSKLSSQSAELRAVYVVVAMLSRTEENMKNRTFNSFGVVPREE